MGPLESLRVQSIQVYKICVKKQDAFLPLILLFYPGDIYSPIWRFVNLFVDVSPVCGMPQTVLVFHTFVGSWVISGSRPLGK
jgi:hypothetical protein